jgi:Cupin-like domain
MVVFNSGVARLSACIAITFLLTTSLLHVWQVSIEPEDLVMMNEGKVLRINILLSNLRLGGQERHQAWYHHPETSMMETAVRSREMSADGRREKEVQAPYSPSHAAESKEKKRLRNVDSKKRSGILSHRQQFELKFPPDDINRTRRRISALLSQRPASQQGMPYDPFDCPDVPPHGYPMSWPLASHVLRHWNVDSTTIPPSIHQGLCVFDWETESAKAKAYREAEVPFVVVNHPDILRTAERWNHPEYLRELVGRHRQRNDHSRTGHFMFWRLDQTIIKLPEQWEPPTDEVKLTYDEWLERANELEAAATNVVDSGGVANRDHYYFRLNGNQHSNMYLYDELPVFKPSNQSTFMVVNPEDHPGINCRFGSRGSVAEAHFDMSRNFILLLGGKRRYILSPPTECTNMELHPDGHPSSRHSKVDWSNPPSPDSERPFAHAGGSEVVLQAGGNVCEVYLAMGGGIRTMSSFLCLFLVGLPVDALYLPDLWFHFIVSLGTSSLLTHFAPLKRACSGSV